MQHLYIKGTNSHLLVFFHGSGGDENSLLFLRKYIDSNASIISFRGDCNGRFFAPLINGKLNKENFELKLCQFLSYWKKLDLSHFKAIHFIGFSNGANFILGLLTKTNNLAHSYLLLHPANLNYDVPIKNKTSHILITCGENDQLIDVEKVKLLYEKWKHLAYPKLQLRMFYQGHGLSHEELENIKEWYYTEVLH